MGCSVPIPSLKGTKLHKSCSIGKSSPIFFAYNAENLCLSGWQGGFSWQGFRQLVNLHLVNWILYPLQISSAGWALAVRHTRQPMLRAPPTVRWSCFYYYKFIGATISIQGQFLWSVRLSPLYLLRHMWWQELSSEGMLCEEGKVHWFPVFGFQGLRGCKKPVWPLPPQGYRNQPLYSCCNSRDVKHHR